MSHDDVIEGLRKFGLSTNQAKIYLAILRSGHASVSDISKATGIPREDIYRRILPKLESVGLVTRLLGSTIKVTAVPPESALGILSGKAEQMVIEMKQAKDGILELLQEPQNINVEENDEIEVILKKACCISKYSSIYDRAQKKLDLIFGAEKNTGYMFSVIAEGLEKAIKQKISIRIIGESREKGIILNFLKSLPSIAQNPHAAKVRFSDSLTYHCALADDHEALVSLKTLGLQQVDGFWTNNRTMVGILKRDYNRLWRSASKENI